MKQVDNIHLNAVPEEPDIERRAEVVFDGTPSGFFIPGCCLEAAVQVAATRYVIFTNHDCPFEEALTVSLVDRNAGLIDCLHIGWMYATGTFSDLQISESDIRFRFMLIDRLYVLEVFEQPVWHIPLIGESIVRCRRQPFWRLKKHLRLRDIASPERPCLSLDCISVKFAGLKALDSVSLTLKSGEILGLIGPNGSGKSTLINAITGHLPIDGRIYLCHRQINYGMDLTMASETFLKYSSIKKSRFECDPPELIAQKGISRTFQTVRLFSQMTVQENVEVAALKHGASKRDAVGQALQLLERFGLADKAGDLAESLSYGDGRRLEIARALAAKPKFLLLDEPAAGMNDTESAALRALLARLPEEFNLGLLIVDHDMELMMNLCPRLHVLAFGKTLIEGTPEEVRNHPDVIAAYLGKPTT